MPRARDIVTQILLGEATYEDAARSLIEAEEKTPEERMKELETRKAEAEAKMATQKAKVPSLKKPYYTAKAQIVDKLTDIAGKHPWASMGVLGLGAYAAGKAALHAVRSNFNPTTDPYQHLGASHVGVPYGYPQYPQF